MTPWQLESVSPNVAKVKCKLQGQRPELWVLLRTDAHHDNPKCDWNMERKHLKEAIERNAVIIDNGDLFCAMQGKYDKRASKKDVRPVHNTDKYLDSLVDEAVDFYEPYSKNFAIMGQGNHETKILKNHETNLTKRLVMGLRSKKKIPLQMSGYSGWVRFEFVYEGTKRQSKVLHHYHGSGGGGPVTRGVIQTNRMSVYTPDADIIFSGHTHDEWIVPIARQRLSQQGVVKRDEVIHCRAPGYKDAWGTGYGGWEVETAKGPKPIGALWLKFYIYAGEICMDITRAK